MGCGRWGVGVWAGPFMSRWGVLSLYYSTGTHTFSNLEGKLVTSDQVSIMAKGHCARALPRN